MRRFVEQNNYIFLTGCLTTAFAGMLGETDLFPRTFRVVVRARKDMLHVARCTLHACCNTLFS